jgi:hypothetical protein
VKIEPIEKAANLTRRTAVFLGEYFEMREAIIAIDKHPLQECFL